VTVYRDTHKKMETVLFEATSVHVFSLPATDVLRSDAWDGHHIWSGQLRLVRPVGDASGGVCYIKLLEPNGTIFGQCPLRDADTMEGEGAALRQCTDSTRGFVLRIEDGSGDDTRFAFVGLHFEDRSIAYNFSSAVIQRRKSGAQAVAASVLAVGDHTLAPGKALTLDFAGKVRTTGVSGGAARGGVSSGNGEFISDTAGSRTAGAPGASRMVGATAGAIEKVDLFAVPKAPTSAGASRRLTAQKAAAGGNENSAAASSGKAGEVNSTAAATPGSTPSAASPIAPATVTPTATAAAAPAATKPNVDLDDMFGPPAASAASKSTAISAPAAPANALDALFA
jgi:hypothetical protein